MTAVHPETSTNEGVSHQNLARVNRSSLPCFSDGDGAYRVVHSFSQHDTIKLHEDTFVQWRLFLASSGPTVLVPLASIETTTWDLDSSATNHVYHK
ncbi:hypothetical protein J1N35_011023 [Gossypium stocksii]|uniref:Uncharacterized protein n=1 Tax=Gossypium stocksii TaxID=47602 RepID=A0A9D3W389_9ROSI|nr:hypothetical protein J1N35_011023 [Gossypium stocksii]